jgi:hypothetical protein
VPKLFQLLAEFEVVIDLPVENDPGGAILIVNRLSATLEIDYREAAHSQTHWPIDIEAVIVWTTMAYCGTHSGQQGFVNI